MVVVDCFVIDLFGMLVINFVIMLCVVLELWVKFVFDWLFVFGVLILLLLLLMMVVIVVKLLLLGLVLFK